MSLGNRSAKCPNCGKGADGFTVADGPRSAVPKEGDAAVCAYCVAVNVYRADLTLRPATDDERGEVLERIGRRLLAS